jgi:hypothetical protein
MDIMKPALCVITVILVVVGVSQSTAQQTNRQLVYVGIAASLCGDATSPRAATRLRQQDTILAESDQHETMVWATGFLDAGHALLELPEVRSSMSFTYARLQNYCHDHENDTLREAALVLLDEDFRAARK